MRLPPWLCTLCFSSPPPPPPLLPHPWLGRHSLHLFISVGNVFREAQRILRLSSSNYRRTAVEVQMPVKQKPTVRSINSFGSNKVQSETYFISLSFSTIRTTPALNLKEKRSVTKTSLLAT